MKLQRLDWSVNGLPLRTAWAQLAARSSLVSTNRVSDWPLFFLSLIFPSLIHLPSMCTRSWSGGKMDQTPRTTPTVSNDVRNTIRNGTERRISLEENKSHTSRFLIFLKKIEITEIFNLIESKSETQVNSDGDEVAQSSKALGSQSFLNLQWIPDLVQLTVKLLFSLQLANCESFAL